MWVAWSPCACNVYVCVSVHSRSYTRQNVAYEEFQLSSIIYNSRFFSPAITLHSLLLQPSSSRPPPLHCLSSEMLLCPACVSCLLSSTFVSLKTHVNFYMLPPCTTSCLFILFLTDVDLLAVRDSGGIFVPQGISAWLCTEEACISLTSAGGSEQCSFEWKPVWQQRDFSSGC